MLTVNTQQQIENFVLQQVLVFLTVCLEALAIRNTWFCTFAELCLGKCRKSMDFCFVCMYLLPVCFIQGLVQKWDLHSCNEKLLWCLNMDVYIFLIISNFCIYIMKNAMLIQINLCPPFRNTLKTTHSWVFPGLINLS